MKIIFLTCFLCLAYTKFYDYQLKQWIWGCFDQFCYNYDVCSAIADITIIDPCKNIYEDIQIRVGTELVQGQEVKVNLYYFDDKEYYPCKCLLESNEFMQASVYSIEGPNISVQKRVNVNSQGRPDWPKTTKVHDDLSKITTTSFMVTISDLQTKGCEKSEQENDSLQYNCYFLQEWEERGILLVQYFFNIKVQVNSDFSEVIGTDTEPLHQKKPTPPTCFIMDSETCITEDQIIKGAAQRSSLNEGDHRKYEVLNKSIKERGFGFISTFSLLMVFMFLMI